VIKNDCALPMLQYRSGDKGQEESGTRVVKEESDEPPSGVAK
jgi:hypothetical protein